MNFLKPVILNMKKVAKYSSVGTKTSRLTVMLSIFWGNFYANKFHAYKKY